MKSPHLAIGSACAGLPGRSTLSGLHPENKCPASKRWHAVLLAILLGAAPAQAVILFGLDNSANQTDPGTGVQFSSVGLLSELGKASPQGSAIHLGGGYMLTADHVGMRPYVTFDGTTFYQRDISFAPVQVAANVDLKIFKLTTTPPVASANIYGGTSELFAPATQIGWGLGRDPAVSVNSTAVTWGNDSTIAKRWGLNTPRETGALAYLSYAQQGIATVLGSNAGSPAGLGADEAAATLYDSGSGLFQYLDGSWQLIGVAVDVDTFNTSNFGNDQTSDPNGDKNNFVRVGAYQSQILSLIPEATTFSMFAGGLILSLARRRRRDG